MNDIVVDFVNYIVSDQAPKNNKETVASEVVKKYGLIQDRKVFYCDFFAVRFSYSKNNSFSNTILSLSHLQKFDNIPFFVVLIKQNGNNLLYLANSSFLSKISHSSQLLSMTNIKGSFNGSDIIKQYEGIENCAANVLRLYPFHYEADWNDNLARLVDATNSIQGTGHKFLPDAAELSNINDSYRRAFAFVNSANFHVLKQDLDDRVNRQIDAIMVASHIPNVNIRGRLIEYLIASDDNQRDFAASEVVNMTKRLPIYDTHNGLGDYVRSFEADEAYTDIKTKILYLDSNPKAYNIDKFLSCMSKPNTVFLFYFVGIGKCDVHNKILCSVYDSRLISATVIQHHWSGRNSRGVTQFVGEKINGLLNVVDFQNEINNQSCANFIQSLLCR